MAGAAWAEVVETEALVAVEVVEAAAAAVMVAMMAEAAAKAVGWMAVQWVKATERMARGVVQTAVFLEATMLRTPRPVAPHHAQMNRWHEAAERQTKVRHLH